MGHIFFDEGECLQFNKEKHEQCEYCGSTNGAKATMFEPPAPLPSSLVPKCFTGEVSMREPQVHSREDAQLFIVEDGRLDPFEGDDLPPGIYKKIPIEGVRPAEGRVCNVFLTTSETRGRIISASSFPHWYVSAESNVQLATGVAQLQPRGGVLSTNGDGQKAEVLPTLFVQKNNLLVQEPWDALSKKAYKLVLRAKDDRIVIDRNRKEIVQTDKITNVKFIYRAIAPETLGLQPRAHEAEVQTEVASAAREPIKLKLGRPRKWLQSQQIPINARQQQKRTASTAKETLPVPHVQQPTQNTRSGRVVKLTMRKPFPVAAAVTAPKPMPTKEVEPDVVVNPPEDSAAMMRNFLAELKDSDFRCRKVVSPPPKPPASVFDADKTLASISPTKRHVPPEAICPTCKKIFLGRRINRHFVKYPNHMSVPQTMPLAAMAGPSQQANNDDASDDFNGNEELTLFRFLITKLQKSGLSEDQRADMFLNELNDLVEQLQLRSSRLIRNTSGLHLVTARTARVLGIPEGHYALDIAALQAPPEPEMTTTSLMSFEHINTSTLPPPTVNTRSLDYTTLSMSLDGTLTDEAAQKLNLSAGGKLLPPSEESLLRAVDDLVPVPEMTKLASTNLHLTPPERIGDTHSEATLMPHYDHASDNAVEAVSMKETNTASQQAPPIRDLVVDFFQFNN